MDAHAVTSGPEEEDHTALPNNAAAPASVNIADTPLGPSSKARGAGATHDFQDDQRGIRRLQRPSLVGNDAPTTSSSDDHRPGATRTNSYESSAGLENMDVRHGTT